MEHAHLTSAAETSLAQAAAAADAPSPPGHHVVLRQHGRFSASSAYSEHDSGVVGNAGLDRAPPAVPADRGERARHLRRAPQLDRDRALALLIAVARRAQLAQLPGGHEVHVGWWLGRQRPDPEREPRGVPTLPLVQDRQRQAHGRVLRGSALDHRLLPSGHRGGVQRQPQRSWDVQGNLALGHVLGQDQAAAAVAARGDPYTRHEARRRRRPGEQPIFVRAAALAWHGRAHHCRVLETEQQRDERRHLLHPQLLRSRQPRSHTTAQPASDVPLSWQSAGGSPWEDAPGSGLRAGPPAGG